MLDQVAELRRQLHDLFDSSESCRKHFFKKKNEDNYAAYYTSMYLLQDTTESLLAHREKGFSDDKIISYIELWGLFQAIIIHQDSIKEIYRLLTKGKKIYKKQLGFKIRQLRNLCAGHPVKRTEYNSTKIERSFAGRNFGGYNELKIEIWDNDEKKIIHKEFNLGKMIDDYASEAEAHLKYIVERFNKIWM